MSSFYHEWVQTSRYAVDQAFTAKKRFEASLKWIMRRLVDIMLPNGWFGVGEELRRRHKTIPVIFLSAKREVNDRIRGLEKGGDDYLTKPFSFSELWPEHKPS